MKYFQGKSKSLIDDDDSGITFLPFTCSPPYEFHFIIYSYFHRLEATVGSI